MNTILEQAIVAARAGRRAEARQLLETVLDADQRNEQAWLWMSGVVDDDEERIICLENVLTINPHNETARKGLAALGVMPVVDQSSQAAFSEPASEVSSVAPPAIPAYAGTGPPILDMTGEPASPRTRGPDRRPFIALTVVLVLMLICTVIGILAYVILAPAG